MELRTVITVGPSDSRITYSDKVIFTGSCFATSVGRKLESGRMPVLINPFGTVYNPVSVCNTLNAIADKKEYRYEDLIHYGNRWVSPDHYTDFSGEDPSLLLERINSSVRNAGTFLADAKFLFVTFGTARTYRFNESGRIVSNCHKIPASSFTRELLTVEQIVTLWSEQIDRLSILNPQLKLIFTISPVRHLKDGAHGNQVSKSVLFLAVEELLRHPSKPGYFPAYELVMDDLRDYRFYDDDMLHPSPVAIDYIWEAFARCYLDDQTVLIYNEVLNITKAVTHAVRTDSRSDLKLFAETMLNKIDSFEKKHPAIILEKEREYFKNMLR